MNPKSFKKLLVCLLTIFLNTKLYAVQTVYRADTEIPQTVFVNGISAQLPGGSNNLLTHLEGYSMRQGNDNLITTFTSEVNFNLFDVPRFYLYAVRADAHFYDVTLTLRSCIDYPVSPLALFECEDLLNNQQIQSGHLFVTRNNIPATNIYSATEFNYNPTIQSYQAGEITLNPGYEALNTQSNPYDYPITEHDVSHLFEHMGLILAVNQPQQPMIVNRGLPLGACPIRRPGSHMQLSLNTSTLDEDFGCKYIKFTPYSEIIPLLFDQN